MKRWICIAVGLLICANAFAQDSLGVRKIGDVGGWINGIRDLEIQDSLIYLLTPDDGLHIYGIPNTWTIPFISRNMALTGQQIMLFGDLAVIWRDSTHTYLVDISDSSNAYFLSDLETTGPIADACVYSGHFLALTSRTSGLWVFDIATPEEPVLTATLAFSTVIRDADAYENYLYVSGTDSMRILDISTPANPQHVNSIAAHDALLIAKFSRIYACDLVARKFTIYSIADPVEPEVVVDSLFAIYADRISFYAVGDSLLWETSQYWDYENYHWEGHVTTYSIGNPDTMIRVHMSQFIEDKYASVGSGAMIIWPAQVGYMQVFGLDSAGNIVYWTTPFINPHEHNEVCVDGDALVSVMSGHGWNRYVVDSNGLLTETYRTITESGNHNITLCGHRAGYYLGHYQIYDISDPAAPYRFPHAWQFWRNFTVASFRDSVCFGARIYEYPSPPPLVMRICLFSDTNTVSLLDTFGLNRRPNQLETEGVFVYTRDDSGVTVINASVLDSLWIVSSLDFGTATTAMDVSGSNIIVGLASGQLKVVDVSDPADPLIASSTLLSAPILGVEIDGTHAFIANDSLGLRIFDLSNPALPVEIGHYRSGHIADDVAAQGDYVYLANTGQILVLDVSDALDTSEPERPELPSELAINCFPNPFNPITTIQFSLASGSSATLRLFNVNGQLVKTLLSEFAGPGKHEVTFDGSEYSSGIYFVQLQAASTTLVTKLALVK